MQCLSLFVALNKVHGYFNRSSIRLMLPLPSFSILKFPSLYCQSIMTRKCLHSNPRIQVQMSLMSWSTSKIFPFSFENPLAWAENNIYPIFACSLSLNTHTHMELISRQSEIIHLQQAQNFFYFPLFQKKGVSESQHVPLFEVFQMGFSCTPPLFSTK